MKSEMEVFQRYLERNGLNRTLQREAVLEAFLRTEEHLTVEELFRKVQEKTPGVGRPTVFRTLKLLVAAGLARTLRLEDRVVRYEHAYRHSKHGHLVCEKCERIIESEDPGIESLQEKLCRRAGFQPRYNRFKIYGTCFDCLRGGAP